MDKKYKFNFPEGNVQDSVVFSMVNEYKIEPNIMRAEIDESGCGMLIMRLRGNDDKVEAALEYAAKAGVTVNELGKHIQRDKQRCYSCGSCVSVCPTKSFTFDPETYEVHLDIDTCVACGSCLSACPTGAVTLTL